MSIEFVLRLIGMVVLAIGGWQLGVYLSNRPGGSPEDYVRYVLILSLSGAALGLLLTPWFTEHALQAYGGPRTMEVAPARPPLLAPFKLRDLTLGALLHDAIQWLWPF